MQTLQRTPLHDRHVVLGARLVPFAGWEMPVQYEGVIPEHRAVRTDCGVFDVSHMGEIEVEGMRAEELLQGLLIVNASNRESDYRWLKERELPGSDVRDVSDEYALLAVQGPRAIERLGLPEARAFTFAEGAIDGIDVMVNRTGYTGEPGCELLVMAEDAGGLWDRVLDRGAVPCGLGARDTLRLEVCFPLHGNDISPDTDAVSAGLAWCCALDKEFSGAQQLREIKAHGPERKLVPFVMIDRAIPRQGMPIDGGGEVTSGTHSPMLDVGIGMGYVPM